MTTVRTLQPEVITYDQLLHAIRQTRAASQQRIESAVEQEKVRECWETGKLIHEHILRHKERADYGKLVIERLAKDLGTSSTELYYMLEFAREYPILRTSGELTWSNYQALLSINDPTERKTLEDRTINERWTQDQLKAELRKRRLKPISLPKPQAIEPGKVGVYRIVKWNNQLKIDLGFDIYHDLPKEYARKFKEGDLVSSNGKGQLSAVNSTLDEIYTYKAIVDQVVDGDTFYALIDLGFGNSLYQRLRLRQLDAPELVSAEGKESKVVLEKALGITASEEMSKSPRAVMSTRVLIKTTKSDDQYGRYLVDVFLPLRSDQTSSGGTQTTGDEYGSINQVLLDSGVFTVRGDE